jgi:hypothetical protein
MNSAPTLPRWMLGGRGFLSGVAVLAMLALAGCGSGSSSMSMASTSAPSAKQSVCSGCGTAMVSLTDAPGDFVSYIVTVDSLTLTRSDGTVVQTVPLATQVDFTQLVNLSEILTAHQVPPGNYTSAQLTLDYSNADIVVSTSSGNVTVPAADILDGSTGKPISGPLAVTLSFGDQPLIITAGTVSNLALDFNLAASNTVDLTSSPVTVTVNPVLSASLAQATSKQIHVRGALVSVSASNSDYVVNVRPFDDPNDNDDFGQFTVNTTATTSFLINGTSYTGSAGLTALAALPANTFVAAYGTWDTTAKTFTASVVHAGTSVSGVSGNTAVGTVAARSGNTVTLDNVLVFQPPGSNSNSDDDLDFQKQISVTVGSNTMVTEEGATSGTFTTSDISVGQRVRFMGTISTSGSGTSLDATSGSALLLPTRGTGLYTSSGTGSITVNLQSLGHVLASSLNFAGTGTTGNDASAASYVVQIPSTFSTASFAAGLPVQFTGFVTPFGSAPPDFSASTVISYAQAEAALDADWSAPGTTTAFTALSSTELVIGQPALQAATIHVIRIDDNFIDASTLSGGVMLVPASATSSGSSSGSSSMGTDDIGDDQAYAIVHQSTHEIDTFSTFSTFTTALNTDLSSDSVLGVFAKGTYGANNTITVDRVFVVLNN